MSASAVRAAIPAIGPFLAGGAIGGLLGMGIPRHKAEYHEQQVRAGRTLVTVQTAEPAIAERIFTEAGAADIDRGNDDVEPAADERAATRVFPVEDEAAVAPESVAVPGHELCEADAYREAGVAQSPETVSAPMADDGRDIAPDRDAVAVGDSTSMPDERVASEEAPRG